ncbi:hypothetical protein Ancab_018143 [Ancistrocladus abbreviatus]
MGSALETLCGQAVGAGQLNMLGLYMQRSVIITRVTAYLLSPIYPFASPLLKLLHRSKHISQQAGQYAIWFFPQLFAYAHNYPIKKFPQVQSKIWVMTIISILVMEFHIFLNWFLITVLRYSLFGAALAGNISWWILVLAQIVFVVSGFFPESWTGLSLSAFESLPCLLRPSVASALGDMGLHCGDLRGWLVTKCKGSIGFHFNLHRLTALDLDDCSQPKCCSQHESFQMSLELEEAAQLSIAMTVTTSTLFGVHLDSRGGSGGRLAVHGHDNQHFALLHNWASNWCLARVQHQSRHRRQLDWDVAWSYASNSSVAANPLPD